MAPTCASQSTKKRFKKNTPQCQVKIEKGITNVEALMSDTDYVGKANRKSPPASRKRDSFVFEEENTKQNEIILTPEPRRITQNAEVTPEWEDFPSVSQNDDKDHSMTDMVGLKAKLREVQHENESLKRTLKDVSRVCVVDESALYRVCYTVKVHLFQKVKFMITKKTTDIAMDYLVEVMGIETLNQQDWINTYLHHVRAAMNNKQNLVAQDMGKAMVGTFFALQLHCL